MSADRQDSHGDWEIELFAALAAALIVGAFTALFVILLT